MVKRVDFQIELVKGEGKEGGAGYCPGHNGLLIGVGDEKRG